jgi:hypothetical protein
MSEGDTFKEAERRAAGVSLHRPQPWYTEKQPWGTAVLRRASPDPRLAQARLELELAPEAAAQYIPEGCSRSIRVDKVCFALKDWLTARDSGKPFSDPRDRAGPGVWRSLLVEHGLLAHPELVLAGAEVSGAQAAAQAKGMDDGCAHALRKLRRRFENLMAARDPKRFASPVRCEECFELDEQRRHNLLRLPGGPAPPRWLWDRIAEGKPDCVHVPLATSALLALCKGYPELIFELLGLLVPEGALQQARSGPGPTPTRESRRFVLEPAVLELLLGNWLLDERDRGAQHRSARGQGRLSGERRSFRLSAAARQAQAGSALPEGLRAGVSFAAVAWGIQGSIERLAWRPAPDGGAAARRPVFDVKASDRLDVPRFLPEARPPPPPPGREAPRRRRREREVVPRRVREVRRRAK